ncbi:hypothetical protein NUW58_g4894 [Xylaria curta]|uniref:Uncharacterized protein n=1 Tax=Xylaria curta TaxID=42375 RepID=A0ACC1P5L8_9PEZI|nr:hypothetical protein NUW58_g4894 [Xylaria curta]
MTVLPPDPYKVLGVSKDAQILEIRAAYRKLVLKCHPDKIQDPALKEEKQVEFQQVQQAYELLGNEVEREKYDRKAEVYELVRERERAKTSAARATSSTPKQDPIYYHVKEASPRATTFANSSPYGRTPPRSWEDTTSKARQFEESARYARKTASYEKERPSKREEERRRRKEDEGWAREKEREREREREMKEARKAKERKEEKDRTTRDREDRDKEKRKEEKKKIHSDREKEREKQRKSDAAEKHRSRHIPIIEETSDSSDSSDDDVIYEPKPDRKKSSSGRKPEDVDPLSTSDRTRKYSGNMEEAIRYLTKSGSKAPPAFNRAQTFSEGFSKLSNTPMVPTPPPATTPFVPPPPQVNEPEEISEDDDTARRSSARPSLRRMSHDNSRSSREKPPSHKKSGSSRDHQPPIIVEAGSPHQVPGFGRSETWYPQTDRERDRHERSRSRPTQGVFAENDESDDDQERRHRPSRRTQSPEPMRAQVRYAVDGTKSIPIRPKQYHEQPLRGSYKTKTAHIIPNSSAPRAQRKHTAYARDYYEDERPQYFSVPEVKYATQFDERDISYSDMPYRGSYRADIHAL